MTPTQTLIAGLIMLALIVPLALKRVAFLVKWITDGQPDPERWQNTVDHPVAAGNKHNVEVLGQKKLLRWTLPGIAHAFVMYAFFILLTVYIEAFGILFTRNPKWAIPLIGHWDGLGFAQDTISLLCLLGLAIFSWIRIKNAPEKLGRKSRFDGSHLGGAWLTLFMIFNIIWTLLLFRGAAAAAGNFPYGWGAYASNAVGRLLSGLPEGALSWLEGIGLLLHIGVMLVFSLLVLHSKHLHIFIAPVNVTFGRRPVALGAVKPLLVNGESFNLEMVEAMDEDAVLGIGKAEDFTWKGNLDFASCTECGRCQSQCPAWNTEKPLSPKMLIMNLRDHSMAKAEGKEAEQERELVGATEGVAWHPSGGAVIDPDVLWSCTNCGACVNQCPVDIEHVDHITDMRRYQVLIESNFPAELNNIFKGMERKGNPWGMDPKGRMDWAKDLPFEVKQVGVDIESLDEVEWLFWVGCAGAFEDRQKKTTQAVAELLHTAGVEFAVLGDGETCTGDSARRAGNEFLFQQLAMENSEVFKEMKVKKVVSTCAHCFNTLKNEYEPFGVELEVVHHTQLLNRLVREKKLVPVPPPDADAGKTITYHDPCFLGRHNQVYAPPRELIEASGLQFVEMPRHGEKSFCCGAGGARMWMEETIGERINVNRTQEAVATGADEIAVGCPFCNVMLSDGLTAQQAEGKAGENVKIIDVAQMLLASVRRGQPVPAAVPAAEEEATESVVEEAEAITAAAVGAGAAAEASDDSTESTESASAPEPEAEADVADDAVPSEPDAALAVAPFSEEAEKAKEEFSEEAVMADEVEQSTPTNDETPAEHLMEHNADLEPTDEDARDEEAEELAHEHESSDEPEA
ncbi:MAG: (Fe-S)-binding protein [Aeromicrobium sp.]